MSLRRLVIDGRETGYFDQLAWPGVALLPNLPATVAPLGLSAAVFRSPYRSWAATLRTAPPSPSPACWRGSSAASSLRPGCPDA